MGILLKIHPDTPAIRQVQKVVDCLESGGIVIYPTDTVYGIGCSIYKPKAIEKIAKLKGIKPEKANFSFICYDLSDLSKYSRPISTHIYKIMRKALPGPFTFIIEANNNVPKLVKGKKKTVGIRVPDNNIPRDIVNILGHPIMSTSIHDEDEIIEYTSDPELIFEKYKDIADIIIDGGYGDNEASTVIDCTKDEIEIIRQGKGIIENFI
jgi:tRNA threonylcarbamoyl adenosine modification protein (Sua5/YciO/YrdC/YwlC family)